MIRFDVVNM